MAKKNNELTAAPVSKWDGGMLAYWGIQILTEIVVAIFVLAGFFVAAIASGIVGNSVPLAEDLLNPANLVYILAGGALCGIGVCWACIIYLKWETRHTVISGQRLKLQTNTWSLFWHCVLWIFLTVITFGIFSLWLPIKVRKWQIKNTVSIPEEAEEVEEAEAEEATEEEAEVEAEEEYQGPKITFVEYDDEDEVFGK